MEEIEILATYCWPDGFVEFLQDSYAESVERGEMTEEDAIEAFTEALWDTVLIKSR